jgi:ABC-type molybdate transport system substrate-binding protein
MNETPIGNYTNQLLSNINQEKIHGENYADSFIKNIVSKERNVKLVASKVLLKEIDVAVVYETDYASIDSNEIYRINIPTDININTSIYGGVLKGSLKYNLSEEFLKYVSSEEVKHIWLENGFIITDCDC